MPSTSRPGREPDGSWTRRKFLARVTSASAGATLAGQFLNVSTHAAQRNSKTESKRKRIALLATEVRKYAHAQHFLDRFLEGYGWEGKHHRPAMDLVALYVDQFPDGDLSRDRERRHGVKIFPSIADALTLGGSKLAVDGVVIIGEHGRYPRNAKGQTLYPRYKFFKEVVKVFEASGRSVPVFNDKHLSTNWIEAVEMVEHSRRLGFAFLAGSSLPVTWRIPALEIPLGTPMVESVCACYGGVDSYDFHGLETAQCMSERRRGGEVGVKSVHAVRGEKLWELLDQRAHTKELFFAALARSHMMRPPPGYTFARPDLDRIRQASPTTTGYFIEHLDGFKTAMFLLAGLIGDASRRDYFIQDFNYAGLLASGETVVCQMHLPMPPRWTTLADFFNPLVHHIEAMILTGVANYPVERTLLTTGMTEFAVESLYRGQVPVQTPELKVAYKAPRGSFFWRS